MKGFKEFLMRGNIVDLAVAVVIGGAFGAIVTAFADDFIGGLIATAGGLPNIGEAMLPGTKIVWGTTVTAAINFVVVAAVVYFAVVVPMNRINEINKKEEEEAPPADDVVLLQEIRDLLAQRQTTP